MPKKKAKKSVQTEKKKRREKYLKEKATNHTDHSDIDLELVPTSECMTQSAHVTERDGPPCIAPGEPGCSTWRTVNPPTQNINCENNNQNMQGRHASQTTQNAKITEKKKRKAELERKRYHRSQFYRERAIVRMQIAYKTNPAYRAKVQKQSKIRSKNLYDSDSKHRQKRKELSIRKYAKSEMHKTHLQELSKQKYQNDPNHRETKQHCSILKYRTNQAHRETVKRQSKDKYRTNQAHRESVKRQSKDNYRTNQAHRESVKRQSKDKYRTNQAHRESVKCQSKDKYRTNQAHRESVKRQSKDKYRTNQAHRESVKCQSKDKYRTNEAHRLRVNTYNKRKYKTDQTHMEKTKQKAAARYRTNDHYRAKKNMLLVKRIKQRYHLEDIFRNKINSLKRKRYEQQTDDQKQTAKRRRIEAQQRKNSMKKVIQNFKEACKLGPDYTCCVCNRLLFQSQVRTCDPCKYTKDTMVTEQCINKELLHECDESCDVNCRKKNGPNGNLWICFTCHGYLMKGNMAPEAIANNLSPPPIPEQLKDINSLEEQLLAQCIPFTKILNLPKGSQPGLKGPVVCVPSNIKTTTKVLPRPISGADIIPVKLKRKLNFKGHVNYKVVRTSKVKDALEYLQLHNPLYKDIEIDHNWDTTREHESYHQILENQNATLETSDQAGTSEAQQNARSENDDNADEEMNERDHLNGIGGDTCLQPIDLITEALGQFQDGVFSVAPAQGNTPISMFQQSDHDTEALSFPGLFPSGKNTFRQQRETKLTLSKYFNARLLGADLRFAQNAQYIFFAQYAKELDQMLSGISIAMRKGSTKTKEGQNITANMLSDREQLTQIIKSDTGYRHFESLRGSPAYWKRTMNDLFAMIRQIGLPTFFVTFSAAELSRWPEVIESIEKQKGNDIDFSTLDWARKCEILRSNPVTAVRMFDHRVKEFFSNVINSRQQPLGKVVDHFIRLEFQQRGAPHIHCLLWVENAPIFDEDDDDTVTSFIDQYISCKLPNEHEDPELHEIVQSVQMHRKKHSKSCKKGNKTCRFNFPKCVSKQTFISRPDVENSAQDNEETEIDGNDISKEKANSCLKRLAESLTDPPDTDMNIDDIIVNAGFENYEQFQAALTKIGTKAEIVMQRGLKDAWVNAYNPDLLRAWNANMDIQYILEPYSCVMYILSYISKSEHELGEILKTAQEEMREQNCAHDLRSQMKKLGSVYFENREVSIQESIVRTCSIRLKDSSRNVVFVPTDNNARLSKPLSQIQAIAQQNADEDIWMTSLEDRYKARPALPEFESICQATFASEYRVLSKAEAQNGKHKPTVFKLQNDKGYVMKRTRGNNAVIRFTKFSETQNPEKFFESQLKLYLPFRLESHLKPDQYENYKDFHDSAAVKISGRLKPVKAIVGENRQKFEKSSDALQQAWQQLQEDGPLEDAWSTVSPESDLARRAALEDQDPNANDDRLEGEQSPELQDHNGRPQTLMSVEWLGDKMKPLLQSMNNKQKEVFYYVRDWCIQKVHNKQPEPFYLHVTGGAGTGKSHLIKCIYHEASKILRNTENPEEVKVLLTAPTGTAAFNIGGFTVHSALKIPRTAKYTYEALGNDSLNTLQSQLTGLEILIIDEISMVDRKVMAYIHGRLKQIKQLRTTDRDSFFGGVCILAIGDFYQLPPVRGRPLCIPDAAYGSDLWNDVFKIIKLEEVMRQKEDKEFADLLNTLRTKSKAEQLTSQHEAVLRSRSDRQDTPQDALHVYPKNAQVNDHNQTMLDKHCSDIKIICAQDYSKDNCSGKMKKLPNPKQGASDDLSDVLRMGKGARVMLIRNIDVGDGLVNGAFGTVEEITEKNGLVDTLLVKFDIDKVGSKQKTQSNLVPIQLTEENMSGHKSVIRRQFPLKLAWACTIHKVQGMTVQQIVYDMQGTFTKGQAYVALSRATSLSGLYLKNFDPKLIYRDEKAHSSLQLMTPFDGETSETQCTYEVVHHNVQGLRSKLSDIKANTDFSKTTVLAFTETWLQTDVSNEQIALPGYSICRKDRSDGKGGVALYLSENIEWEQLSIPSLLECCAIKVNTECHAPYVVAVIYRPPRSSIQQFILQLQDILFTLRQSGVQDIFVTGDFNENQLDDQRRPIKDCFSDYGFQQTVNKRTTRYGSILDLMCVRAVNYVPSTTVIQTYYSDHEAVKLFLSVK